MTRLALLLPLALALATPARAELLPRTHDITVEDYFTLGLPTECALSPDGKLVAYAEARWQADTDDRKADLWLVPAAGGPPRRLSADRAGDRALAWAPDGASLYSLAARKREAETKPPFDGKPQVWQVRLDGSDPRPLTRAPEGVTAFALAPDGSALFYSVPITTVEDEWKDMRERYRPLEYGHGTPRTSELRRLDLRTWRDEKLPFPRRHIHELAASPDGRRLALITSPDDRVLSFEGRSRVDVLDLAAKTTRPLPDRLTRSDVPSPYGWLQGPSWSPDGRRLAFNLVFDAYPAEILVARFDTDAPTISCMPRPAGVSVHGYGSPLGWRGPAELCFLGDERARVRLYAVPLDPPGEPRTLTPGDVAVAAFSAGAGKGPAALILADPTRFDDVYILDGSSAPRRLTDLHAHTAAWKLPRVSLVSWKGAGGQPVEAVLQTPANARPGTPLPLVVEIHGGPTTCVSLGLAFTIYGPTLLPAHGYALLSPNYRGSTGYGDRFLTDLVGRENDLDIGDILAGVEALVEKGVADPKRLAVMGWSNGGYLTNCLITRTPRFRAASSGAGIADTVMEWGTNDEPAYAIAFKGGLPWERPDIYRRTSPILDAGKVRTPTIFHVGAGDERCPPGHSRMFYRALREYVKVPTELVVYPGEGHGLTRYRHRKAKMEWDLAWFDRYVLGRRPPGPLPMPKP